LNQNAEVKNFVSLRNYICETLDNGQTVGQVGDKVQLFQSVKKQHTKNPSLGGYDHHDERSMEDKVLLEN